LVRILETILVSTFFTKYHVKSKKEKEKKRGKNNTSQLKWKVSGRHSLTNLEEKSTKFKSNISCIQCSNSTVVRRGNDSFLL
jgi:hypothetical protein